MSRGHYFTAYGRLLVLGLTTACVDVAPEGLNDVSGTYVGHAEIHRDAGARTATATYTLRIANRNGFMHGLWTISGDMAQPPIHGKLWSPATVPATGWSLNTIRP